LAIFWTPKTTSLFVRDVPADRRDGPVALNHMSFSTPQRVAYAAAGAKIRIRPVGKRGRDALILRPGRFGILERGDSNVDVCPS